MDFKTGDSIRVLVGRYANMRGVVGLISEGLMPHLVSVRTGGTDGMEPPPPFRREPQVTWFKPEEITKVG